MTLVPFPDAEVKTLFDATNRFMIWPKKPVLETPQKAPDRVSMQPIDSGEGLC